jgi:hypothetical protein
MSQEKNTIFEMWKEGFKEGQKHTKPSDQTLNFMKGVRKDLDDLDHAFKTHLDNHTAMTRKMNWILIGFITTAFSAGGAWFTVADTVKRLEGSVLIDKDGQIFNERVQSLEQRLQICEKNYR